MRACMCNLFHLAFGNEDGGDQLVFQSTCCLAWGLILDRWTDRAVVCVFSIFNAGGSACGCMRVYTHTHKHTAKMGYSDLSPGVGMRQLEGPKHLDGLNLGIHIFVYVYKAYNGGNRKGVQNVHDLSLTGYCKQNTLSLYMNWGTCGGGGYSGHIESEVRLIYFYTNQKCRCIVCVCHQGSADAWYAFFTKGDEPVTVRPEKIHAELEKAGADPDFVRYMISREDLDGEYYDRVFGGEDSDSDMDISDDDM